MNKFKLVATSLALTGALAVSGAANAASYLTTVDWVANDDIGGAFIAAGTLDGGNSIIDSVLNSAPNNTGYKVIFTGDAHTTNQATLDGLLGAAGAGFTWQYVDSEWRGSAGAATQGFATNGSGVSQTMTSMSAETVARVGFSADGFSAELASAHSIAGGGFGLFDPSVTLADGDVYNFTANSVFDTLDPWVANSTLTALARGIANNGQSGTGNISFSVDNRVNFYVEQRHNYDRVSIPVTAPEPGMMAMMGLGLSLVGFQSIARKRKQA